MASEDTAYEDETTSDLRETPPRRRGRWSRRAGIGVLVLIVGLAALDLLGPRTGHTSTAGGGYELALEFPQITRAGAPAPLRMDVQAEGGFDSTVQLRMCADFFDDLDFQAWYPMPSAETATASWIVYEFDSPPTGNTLSISLDVRVAPGQFGEVDDCQVSVLVQDEPVASATFTTWRMP